MAVDGAPAELALLREAAAYSPCHSQFVRRRPLPVLATHDNGLTTTDCLGVDHG
jgi:hypothetical protein